MGKLVIIDSSKETRITVVDGDQIIGRGGLLKCDDKRISRIHGVIRKEMLGTNEVLFIQALHHTNPIFYRKRDTTTDSVLRQDDSMLLEVGEQFRLLPDGNWFEVGEDSAPDSTEDQSQTGEASTPVAESNQQNSTSESNMLTKRKHEDDEAGESSKRPCAETVAAVEQPSTSSDAPSHLQVQIKPDPDSTVSTATSAIPVTIKPDPDGQVQIPIKPDPDGVGCGPGNGTVPNAVQPLRPSCDFGIRCYRGGADHRAAFAHPGDVDYRRPVFPPPPPGSPLCPFGARCYRRNPEHFRCYDHPDPNVDASRRLRDRNVQIRQGPNDSSDDDDYDDYDDYEEFGLDFLNSSSDEFDPRPYYSDSDDDDMASGDSGEDSVDSGINN